MSTRNHCLDVLRRHGQEHLAAFWDELGPNEQESLAAQIDSIDFALVDRLFHGGAGVGDVRALADRATEPPAFRLGSERNRYKPAEARRRGEDALAAGEVAVLIVAGGQGTRLGFDHPKGMFPIGPVSGKTLFQLHTEKVLALSRRYGKPVPLCLMTSPATHEKTVEFFLRHGRFGLPEDDFFIFRQGTMPAVDARTGQVLLADRGQIALSPDGHGGMLAAIQRSGTLDALRARGFKQLFYLQVDNPLVEIGSPEFLGYHLLSGSEMTTQVVRKQSPKDRVGNVVQVDGRLHVIEYSDLPGDVAERRGPDGSLLVWAGSIAVHAMDLAFLERMAGAAEGLPFHVAHKKVPYVDSSGRRVEPAEPNAVKFERFIFDLLPSARNAIVVEVDPQRHFAPLKNAPGQGRDTPETVQAQMVALYRDWLQQAGASVAEGVPVEISPLFAMDADELARKIAPGTRIVEATYLA